MKIDEVGYWSELKLEIIKKYAVAYSTILTAQTASLEHHYIDAFAGAGVHIAKRTGEFIPGSPLNALNVHPPFKHHHLIDLDGDRVENLRKIAAERPDVTVYEGDCNAILLDHVFPKVRYQDFRRALCILDPYKLNPDWKVVATAGHMKSVEVFLNFMVMDMNMNVLWTNPEGVAPAQVERMNAFWGDDSWRKAAYRPEPDFFESREKKTTNQEIAEAYRHLRTSLLLSSAGNPPKTILVTSSQPSEGKTTTAINTAFMLAQTGAEVLIIDCDLRRPRLHANFNLSNTRGLTNYLSGESKLEEVLQTYDKVPNLKLLTSGPIPPNPAELLGSEEMRKLLASLSEKFTHIVVDSPPAISFTDASIISTFVDGVILVVHGGRSSRAVVRRARQQLLDVGAHIFGVVLNNVKAEAHDYYYGGYYSAYYQSDYYGEADEPSESARAASR